MPERTLHNIRWIFFDWGGTLFDEAQGTVWAAELVAEQLKRRNCILVDAAELARPALEGRSDGQDGLIRTLVDLGVPGAIALKIINATDFSDIPTPYFEGTLETLALLRESYGLGVISNNHVYGFQKFLASRGLAEYFSVVVGSNDAGIRKPDVRIFRMALDEAGSAPQESVMIGDRLSKDISGANAANMRTVRIRQGIFAHEEPVAPGEVPDAEIASIRQLPGLLR